MLDHLLLNNLKWWNVADNADSINANGKTYEAVPKQIEIKSGSYCLFLNDNNSSSAGFYPEINEPATFNCIGVTNDAYFFTGKVTDNYGHSENLYYNAGSTATFIGLVPKNQVSKVIWGGKASLIRLSIKALRHFTRRVAVAC